MKELDITDNWYLDEKLWQNFYDCMFSAEHFQQAAVQIEPLLQLIGFMPSTVLDLACGPGRHSLPLAQRGCDVTAVDRSLFLLGKLNATAKAMGLNDSSLTVVEGDMRDYSQPGAFDLVISMWTSFGYFDAEQDNLDVLSRCHENLKEDGVLVIDTVGKEYLLRELQPVHCREYDDGRLLIERPVLDEDMSRVHIEWLLIEGEKVKRTSFSHSIYTGIELIDRLLDAGFSQVDLYGDWDAADYDIDAERLIAIARK